MKKKSLFLLLFISTSLCAMDEERQKEVSAEQHPTILRNFVKKAQSNWVLIRDQTPSSILRETKTIEVLPKSYFKVLETVLEEEGTEIAEKQLVVLKQLKSDQDRLNELPDNPFEETLKKLKEMDGSGLVSKYQGSGAGTIKSIFDQARAVESGKGVIVLVDELQSLTPVTRDKLDCE